MSTGEIKVNYSSMEALRGGLRQQSAEIQTQLDDLEATANQLWGNWDGDAKEAFVQAKARWSASMAQMHEILGDTEAKVGASAMQYADTDRANAQRML
ncbi:MAG: WXG100 family type VII secretion target [Arachnia propionica]|uniref:WXG100 family type VII secretion target n=1 Tax=Arachnia propionica TaxID=1750 RepID=UPI0026FD131A|nr:WXG100 family type VII secretion target [Arachnia propionica]